MCSGLPVFRWEISLSRVPSRRSPSAHFFSPGQVLLEPHDCVQRIETSGNGPSILAPRRATAWRHNACAQPKRLDQSLFALWCGGFHRLDSASVGHAVGCCGSTFFVPTTWSALNHNPKCTEYEHNTAELRESGESPSFLSPLPDGHVGVVTAWDAEHFLNNSRTCPCIHQQQQSVTSSEIIFVHIFRFFIPSMSASLPVTADKAQSQIFTIF